MEFHEEIAEKFGLPRPSTRRIPVIHRGQAVEVRVRVGRPMTPGQRYREEIRLSRQILAGNGHTLGSDLSVVACEELIEHEAGVRDRIGHLSG